LYGIAPRSIGATDLFDTGYQEGLSADAWCQESAAPDQDLPGVRPTVHLAQEVGAQLGRCTVL
jgi:hypothetical protein